ncbi:MAG: hypothetical protein B7Z78_03810 [Rhodospirillales bacterium 20-60-12]|jgi:uncharacterized membrane protein|nr:MAG: hypothetical protein B7Z78_03810 [Rhodospirillales bacterium 20-60-12]HQT67485.1 CopD family protein [Acetobacteraceae bacterium]HQU01826.1 CopD family protein [Acetobacteraceae bacterium]
MWLTLALILHLLGLIIWVGGMAFSIIVLRPSITALAPADQLALHDRLFRKFFRLLWHIIPTTLLSGWAMIFLAYGGFAALPWSVNAMQTIALVMTGIFLLIYFGPFNLFKTAYTANDAATAADQAQRIRRLITANLALGLLATILGAIGHYGT